jgi:tetratricopeptide (TPR) repeat protein
LAEPPAGLRDALADRYALERELGSGGMATVYLAEDLRHGRKVAVKVLKPELAATMGPERFAREIKIAAQLQHPHILPLLDSGEARGPGGSGPFLFYVMPYIEGESLRERLTRRGELPVPEAVRILTEVVDALAHAHSRGVVHRDIKPDNVMLSGRHALVADFGVAKAVSEATGRQSLTTVGVALGTPAYMAPEQAAADPHVDHRADIYAVGAMAYELLSGRPPFTGLSPQEVLAAHVTQAPEPVSLRRAATPPALAEVVMKCLAKRAADRFQTAEELLHTLEPLGSTSGGTTPTSTVPVAAVRPDQWYGHPLRVAGLFLLAAIAVLGVVYFLTIQLGLPDWVIRGAVLLLVLGLPIMIVTGLVERRRARLLAAGSTMSGAAAGLGGWVSWRKSIRGGLLAFGALAIIAALYTAMRLLGIGPVGTLVASGALKARDRLLVADFSNHSTDSTLGRSVTEAFRVDISQSPLINLMSASAVGEALQRAGHQPDSPLDPTLAREIALREGAKGVVAGDISPVGRGFVLSARLLAAADGSELVALRETADDDGQILKAIDRLSARLRERIGESLRTIRANEPLEQVTTSSLEALRLYTEGARKLDDGDFDAGIPLLRQAVTVDTGFAMAWRKLAAAIANTRGGLTEQTAAATKAYQHRDRLPEIERYQTIAYYFWTVDLDEEKVVSAYRSILDVNPDDRIAVNNLAAVLGQQRKWAESEALLAPQMKEGVGGTLYNHMVMAQMAQGRIHDARATLVDMERAEPSSSLLHQIRGVFFSATGNYDSARVEGQWLIQSGAEERRSVGAYLLAMNDVAQGKVRDGERHLNDFMSQGEKRGIPGDYLVGAAQIARLQAVFLADPTTARKTLEAALQRHPLGNLPTFDRPYPQLAIAYALAGEAAKARQLLKEYQAEVPSGLRKVTRLEPSAEGYTAMAEGKPADALNAFQSWWDDAGGCTQCALPEMGRVYDQLGQTDSALAVYERAETNSPVLLSVFTAPWNDAQALHRLGELYEEKGNRDNAVEYYGRFVALWKDADPELQPQVREAKARMAKLAGERTPS